MRQIENYNQLVYKPFKLYGFCKANHKSSIVCNSHSKRILKTSKIFLFTLKLVSS